MTGMNVALKQQAVDELRRRFADLFARRGEFEAKRKAHTDGAAEQIKRIDGEIEQIGREVYDAERRLRQT